MYVCLLWSSNSIILMNFDQIWLGIIPEYRRDTYAMWIKEIGFYSNGLFFFFNF